MQFLPPARIGDRCTRGDIGDDFADVAVPFMHGVQTAGPFGTVISQDFKGIDYAVYQHHFFIEQGTFLYALADKPILSINYMLRGTPVARIPGIGDIPLAENSYMLFYVPPVRQEVWFEPGDYHCLHIVFDPQYLRKLAYRHEALQRLLDYALKCSDKLLPHESGPIDGMVRNLLDEVMVVREDEAETDIHFRSNVMQLFLQYIKRHHAINTGDALPLADRDRLEAIREYIEGNLADDLCISRLSKRFAVSASTLQRQFSRWYGIPIYRFIYQHRMEKAMALIQTGNMTVAEVSMEVGYNDPSNFSNAFNKYFGFSPSKRHR